MNTGNIPSFVFGCAVASCGIMGIQMYIGAKCYKKSYGPDDVKRTFGELFIGLVTAGLVAKVHRTFVAHYL